MSRPVANKVSFVAFTNEQLTLLEEILDKEIKIYVSNPTFQQFIKDNISK
ncbi:MAG: hypothetical protein R2685_02825 [Candidatus Nitrosocosmicus sp.]|nr:hypothetical protein [Candidatus Nitrosocosmicus sp.]